MGDREFAWGISPPSVITGSHGQSLMLVGGLDEGGLDEIDFGWAYRKSTFNQSPDGRQTYIERQVCVGDRITLGGHGLGAGKGLFHTGLAGSAQQIGYLSRQSGEGRALSDLTVQAVVRYPADNRDPDTVGDLVAQRGRGYSVMVVGRLR